MMDVSEGIAQAAVSYGFVSLLPPAPRDRTRHLHTPGLSVAGRRDLAGVHDLGGLEPGGRSGDAIEGTIAVLADAGSAKVVVVLTFLIGALIAVVEANGGMRGFVRWVEDRQWVTDGRRAQVLAWFLGLVIFIESNLTILVAGSVCRPLFDRFKVSREKLAYNRRLDLGSGLHPHPVQCVGGLHPGHPRRPRGRGAPHGIPHRHPAQLLRDLRPHRGGNHRVDRTGIRADEEGGDADARWRAAMGARGRARADPGEIAPEPPEGVELRPRNMILPIAVMVLCMPILHAHHRRRRHVAGVGLDERSLGGARGPRGGWILALLQGSLDLDALSRVSLKGAGALTGMALVLWLAITLGGVTDSLGTGGYVAGVVGDRVPMILMLPLVFVVAGGIAFATGSSWGTFAIMLAVAVPLATALGLPPSPFVAAVLSGGIFGDHCSPISDTTIIASLASGTDHIEHVRTQLPYALVAGGLAIVSFGILGAVI